MELEEITLKKNNSLLGTKSFVVVGDNVETLILYIARLTDPNCRKHILIIDPEMTNTTYSQIHTNMVEFKKHYDPQGIDRLIDALFYNPPDNGIIIILNNCFPNDTEILFDTPTAELFRKAKRMNLQIILSLKRLTIPHIYYKYFDFFLLYEPRAHIIKLKPHFMITSFLQRLIINIKPPDYLVIDNRDENYYNMYYQWKSAELYNQKPIQNSKIERSENSSCCICMEDIINNDIVIQCNYCRNFGHQVCLLQWYEHNPVCPLCRKEARDGHQTVVFIT